MNRTPWLLALLLPITSAAPASPMGGAYPAGAVIYRDCFGTIEAEYAPPPSPPMGRGQTAGLIAPAPPASAPAPVELDNDYGSVEVVESASRRPRVRLPRLKGKKQKAAPASTASLSGGQPAPSGPEPQEESVAPAFARDLGDSVADASIEAKPPVELQDKEQLAVDVRVVERPVQRSLDWGGTVYLSNDDSMSLASAQRLLYAVKQGLRWSVSQVRPHELLNYFSFDTVNPEPDDVFDVQVSAEQTDGDTLSVALAVRGAMPERLPLDLTMVVDVSCSMADAGRMDFTKRGLDLAQDQLQRGDRIDLVVFDDQVCVPLQNYVVGRDDPALYQRAVAQLQPRGATDLDLGLREGYRLATSHQDVRGRNRRVMVLTDAQLNTGDVDPDTVSEVGRSYEDAGVRLTGVGVGRDFNDQVLDKLTEKGKGAYVYLGSEAVVDRLFGVGFRSLTETLAHDVRFALELPPSLAMERFYGEESSRNKEDVQPINYYAGTSQVFLQDLRLREGVVVSDDPIELRVSYRDARTGEPAERVFHTTVGKAIASDPHNVRKARALMSWADMLTARAMGGDGCGAALSTYAERVSSLQDDVEIGYVSSLVEQMCGITLDHVSANSATVAYKVKVDSDIPIAEVALNCGGRRWSQSLSGGDTVARFQAPAGRCQLTLQGTVAMQLSVDVPSTGGDLRCLVRGGRMSCS